MPNSAGNRSQRKSDEILAGEYVLGVLPAAEQMVLDARMEKDPQFAQVVYRWRRNLEIGEAEHRRKVQAIYDCIYGAAPKSTDVKLGLWERLLQPFVRLWRSILFWRTATALFLLYAVVLVSSDIG